MFAIDGCRLPSNASKGMSGMKKELTEKYEKIKKVCREIIKKHRQNDRIDKDKIKLANRRITSFNTFTTVWFIRLAGTSHTYNVMRHISLILLKYQELLTDK